MKNKNKISHLWETVVVLTIQSMIMFLLRNAFEVRLKTIKSGKEVPTWLWTFLWAWRADFFCKRKKWKIEKIKNRSRWALFTPHSHQAAVNFLGTLFPEKLRLSMLFNDAVCNHVFLFSGYSWRALQNNKICFRKCGRKKIVTVSVALINSACVLKCCIG